MIACYSFYPLIFPIEQIEERAFSILFVEGKLITDSNSNILMFKLSHLQNKVAK